MKVAYVEDSVPERVSAVIQDVLTSRGAILTEHTPSHVRFEGLPWPLVPPRDGDDDAEPRPPSRSLSFDRGGYVGTYQHTGETDVEVRLSLRAHGPARAFWRLVLVELIVALAIIIWNPTAAVWLVSAAVLYVILAVAFLVYLGTWRTSLTAERALFDLFLVSLRERAGELAAEDEEGAAVLTERELKLRRFDEEVEAEILKKRLADERKRGRVAVSPAADASVVEDDADDGDDDDEAVEAKRAQIEALRARLAAQKRGEK